MEEYVIIIVIILIIEAFFPITLLKLMLCTVIIYELTTLLWILFLLKLLA